MTKNFGTDDPAEGGAEIPKPKRLRHRLPGVPREALRRERVDAYLDRLFAESSGVLITAASGAGKTVQAQLYAETTALPVSWITLDSSHTSPRRLLAGLLEAVHDHRSPDAEERTRAAFRLETTVAEAVAVAAGTINREPALLVIDECQHILGDEDAQETLDLFIRYSPDTVRVLLLSTTEVSGLFQQRVLEGSLGILDETELLLTSDESQQLADLVAGRTQDAERVHNASGGWMAGAVFSFRYGLHEQSNSNDLPSVIMMKALHGLSEDEQQFLLDTSVPDAVTRDAAAALCGGEGHRLWDAIRLLHLPATTMTDETVVYHSLFRSFLRRQLLATDPERHQVLVRRYAEYLAGRGHAEEAAEHYFTINAFDEALDACDLAVDGLCQRSDWDTFMRWADRLGSERLHQRPRLVAGLVRSLFGQRRFEETVSTIRTLDQSGRLRPAMEADNALLATAAWALQSNVGEARRLLDRYVGDYRAEVVRFMVHVSSDLSPAVPPIGSNWGDVERIMSWGLLLQGRITELGKLAPTDPQAPVLNPNVILPVIFEGDWSEARDLLDRVPPEVRDRPQTLFIEGVLLLAEGELEQALATLEQSLAGSRATTFFMSPAYELFYGYTLGRLGRRDDAVVVLKRSIEANARLGQTALLEWGQAFLGASYLQDGNDEAARELLDECVRSMRGAHRRLFLPMAAACLSEAEARTGDLNAAHEAAKLAYHTAAMMGSLSNLIPTLQRFPSIVEREDRFDQSERRWHRLVAAPSVRTTRLSTTRGGAHLALQPFGPDRDVIIDGTPQDIGRLKIIELTALLVLHPNGIERAQLQSQLFPEATLRNGGNHFRQISFKFRQITGMSLDRRTGNLVGLPSDTAVESADVRFEELVRSASMVTSEERVHRLRSALSLISGPYLAGSNLDWAAERRNYLAVVEEEARLELARLLLDLKRPQAARTEVETLLNLNRYSDPGYRLLVKIERLIGSESSVLAVYRRAVVSLEELGLAPGDARRLLEGDQSVNK